MERAEVDIRSILSTIRRQLPITLGATLLALVIAGAHILIAKPIYSATALILFDHANKDILDPTPIAAPTPTDRSRIESEVELMKSDTLLLSLIHADNLTEDPEFAPTNSPTEDPSERTNLTLANLRNAISVERRGTTLLLAVTARSINATRSADLANRVAQHYITLQVDQKVQSLLNYRNMLSDHITTARANFENIERAYDRFIDTNIAAIATELGDIGLIADNSAIHVEPDIARAAYLRNALHQKLLSSHFSPKLAFELEELQQNEDFARAQYQALQHRYQSLTTQASLQVPDSLIMSPALPPTKAAWPNRRVILTLAGLLGAMLGIALALLYENLIGSFVSDDQLETALQLTKSGSIPRARARTERDSVSELIVDRPHSPYSEAIRRLRATIGFTLKEQRSPNEQGILIVVTSANVSEGKTTTAVSLARCYALSGKSTLLIDADLHAPSVHRHLTIAPSLLLTETLIAKPSAISAKLLATTDPLTPLAVITGARQTTTSKGELLNTRAFETLLTSARASYDVVIVDTPPVATLTDALYVAPLADLILLVTKWATTSQREVRQTIRALRHSANANLPIVPVLTQVKDHASRNKRKLNPYYTQPAQ